MEYTVQSGDTLSKIAARFSIPGGYMTLFNWNRDRLRSGNPNLIYPGERLRLSAPSSSSGPAPSGPGTTPVVQDIDTGKLMLFGLAGLALFFMMKKKGRK